MLKNLTFLEEPDRFLQSYIWCCSLGLQLSAQCKEQITRARIAAQGAKSDLPATGNITDSLIACYVHAQLCNRCVSLAHPTCQQGHDLLWGKIKAFDRNSQPAVPGIGTGAIQTDPVSGAQIEFALNLESAQQEFLRHRESCPICAAALPRERYDSLISKWCNLPVWNIEAARSQRAKL